MHPEANLNSRNLRRRAHVAYYDRRFAFRCFGVVLLMILMHITWQSVRQSRLEFGEEHGDTASVIFVSIASYRDVHCGKTLWSLYAEATARARVLVGLVDQIATSDTPCVEQARLAASTVDRSGFEKWLRHNVRVRQVKSSQAEGPAMGRFWAAQLARPGEYDYIMQIDSHSTFIPRWDRIVLRQLMDVELRLWPKAILSYHPPTHDVVAAEWRRRELRRERRELEGAERRTFLQQWLGVVPTTPPMQNRGLRMLCDAGQHPDWMVPVIFTRESKNVSVDTCDGERVVAAPQPFTCGGFFFARRELLIAAPYADFLRYVFHGEEVYFTARAYVRGWRSFRPCETILSHIPEREHEPSLWKDVKEATYAATRDAAYTRLLADLHLNQSATPHATDTEYKAIEDFWSYIGFDRRTGLMNASKWGC
jgi:hypothetical protein